jgi:lipopolysaccharide export system protein LptA
MCIGSFFQNGRLLLLLLCVFALQTYAQGQDPTAASGNVQVEAGEALEQIIINGKKVRHFTGGVTVRQPGQVLTATEAYQYVEQDSTAFIGNVKIDQGGGKVIMGDQMSLVGKSRIAKIRGNVNYLEGTRTLKTQALDYDPETGQAVYTTGGEINDNGTILTSRRGRYDRATGKMFFYGDVKMNSPEFALVTDSLHYNTNSKLADFFGPTTISNPDGVVTATRGTYNTETGKGNFLGRSAIDNKDYRLDGDIVDFNRQTGLGYAQGNVRLFAKKDSLIVTGDRGYFVRTQGKARLYGNTLIKSKAGAIGDTLYIRSDSMNAINDSVTEQRTLLAKSNVKIYQRDFQGICDSLAYNSVDSTIRMYRSPYLWTSKNQCTADTIYARMENNRMDSLFMIRNAFIISEDTLGNYNQVKGRVILADFEKNKIRRAYVRGNGQSIYYAVDEQKRVLSGMNKVVCSNMVIRFDTANQLETITALVKPEARFIPPKEIVEPEKRLKGFNYNLSLRPTLKTFFQPAKTTVQPKKRVGEIKKSTTFKPRKPKTRQKAK